MSYRRTYPHFTVTVESGFSEEGIWAIDAHVKFLDGKTPKRGSRLRREGCAALFVGIAQEGLHGRELGATRATVTMDTGEGPVGDIPLVW